MGGSVRPAVVYKEIAKALIKHSLLFVLLFLPRLGDAQEPPLLVEKPGTFEILRRTDYTGSKCGFTKAEITANLQRITDLVNTIRKNPVLQDLKGFDGRARIYNEDCPDNGGYGIPSRISFEFCSWYMKKDGKPARNIIEPPCWDLVINSMQPTVNRAIFSADDFYRDYFMVPAKKETLERGIDVYDDECFVIYDPARPSYWVPVTVNEAFKRIREHIKNEPDRVGSDFVLKYIETEYDAIPESERNKPAYHGGNPISRITPQVTGTKIMKVNPEYWNKHLPKSAIQFIYFRSVQNKDNLRRLKEEYLQHNSIDYHLLRFKESFDMDNIRALVPLIGK